MRDGGGAETYRACAAVHGKEYAAGNDAPDIGAAGGCDLENTVSVSDGQPGECCFSDLDPALSDGGGQAVAAVYGGVSTIGGGGLRRFGGLAWYFSCDTSMERGMEGVAALFVSGGRLLSGNLLWTPVQSARSGCPENDGTDGGQFSLVMHSDGHDQQLFQRIGERGGSAGRGAGRAGAPSPLSGAGCDMGACVAMRRWFMLYLGAGKTL